ncbi:MAG: HD domain-containing protein [Deltaproteobacteria bacterium]|nr:HD domain-containing protein [Deltaproteobacteria bacterium]
MTEQAKSREELILDTIPPGLTSDKFRRWKTKLLRQIMEANKELWMILSMFSIIGIMNYLLTAQQMLLQLYVIPTIFSAYFFGRRHAVLTAVASILLVGLVLHFNSDLFNEMEQFNSVSGQWYEIMAWASMLVIIAYSMGTLYERQALQMRELQKTYRGLLVILRHFISKDKYTENHCYRVSIYSAKIATYLGLAPQQIETVRAAALLHDIGKIDIGREILYKAAQLTEKERETMKNHVELGADILDLVEAPLGNIIPIILAHHDKYDGSGYHPIKGEKIPIEAKVLSVADVYDALVSDRPYRKAVSPFKAKEIIVKGSGKDFDPKVVDAFIRAFQNGEMEIPNLII